MRSIKIYLKKLQSGGVKESTQKEYERIIKRFMRFSKTKKVYKIKFKNLSTFQKRNIRKSPSQAIRQTNVVYKFLKFWGVEIKKPAIPKNTHRSKTVFYSKENIGKIIAHIENTKNKALEDIFIFALETGLRKKEIFSLEWSQVNIEEKILNLPKRIVPITPKAQKILMKSEKLKGTKFKIFTEKRAIKDKLERISKTSGIKVSLTGARNTFAKKIISASDLETSAKILGVSKVQAMRLIKKIFSL